MNISKELADKIIYSLEDALNLELNLIGTDGIIISSTNKDRENTFHEAAKICAENRERVVIETDDEYIGVKKGINLPVELFNNVVAVIGITGEPKDVSNYATIIKKMTEILFREEWVIENRYQRKNNMRNIIEAVILNQYKDIDLYTGMLEKTPKYFIITKSKDTPLDLDYIYESLDRKYVDNLDIIYTYLFNEMIILVNNKTKSEIEKQIDSFVTLNNLNLKFGISSEFKELSKANHYLKEAQDAYYWSTIVNTNENFISYENMSLGILLTNIDEENKNAFTEKILENIKTEEIEFYKNLIALFGLHNGSITKISESLFMHKNTVQYRLNRIKELTGYDPRVYDQYIVLRLAFTLVD